MTPSTTDNPTFPKNAVFLVDASIYIFRAYFAFPDVFFDSKQNPTNAVYGFAHFLLDLLITQRPKYLVFAFDESLGSCFRNEIYPDYKVSRALPDNTLALQLKRCRQLTELMGVTCLSDSYYEADDLIGSVSKTVRGRGASHVIVSKDKDLAQLLRAKDYFWDYGAKTVLDADSLIQKIPVPPKVLPDWLALRGDSVDDIPGLQGVGEKTATILINEFGSLNQIYRNLDAVADLPVRGATKLAEKLREQKEDAYLFRQLTRIEDSIPLQLSKDDLAIGKVDRAKLSRFLTSTGLKKRLLKKLALLDIHFK